MTTSNAIGDEIVYAHVKIAKNAYGIGRALADMVGEAKDQARELAATKTNTDDVIYAPVTQHISHSVTEQRNNEYAVSIIVISEFRPVFE